VDSGFYAACAGLRAQSEALDVAAHNLANLNTSGFRAQQVTFQSLVALSKPASWNVLNLATNNYGVVEGSHLDLSSGNLETTGNPLDLGLEGTGFFAIQTQRGTRYTRNGSFHVSQSGQLVTASGDPVLGEAGAISVPAGVVAVTSDGTVTVNNAAAGKLQILEFAPGTKLVTEGQALVAAPDGGGAAARSTQVRAGTIESSNVNSIGGVVTLIGVQRQAEMMQRALSMFYTEFNRIAANDLPHV
jgi:flagellar basal-body rod protein FlgF